MKLKLNKPHYSVVTTTINERNLILQLLLNEGIQWHGSSELQTAQAIESEFPFCLYPVIRFSTHTAYMSGLSTGLRLKPLIPYHSLVSFLQRGNNG